MGDDLEGLETDLEQIRTLKAQEEVLSDHLENTPYDFSLERLAEDIRDRIDLETSLLEYAVDL